MKRLIVLFWILACIMQSDARQAKGAKVIANSTIAPEGKTFALIEGISKFQSLPYFKFVDFAFSKLNITYPYFKNINRTPEFNTLMKK